MVKNCCTRQIYKSLLNRKCEGTGNIFDQHKGRILQPGEVIDDSSGKYMDPHKNESICFVLPPFYNFFELAQNLVI